MAALGAIVAELSTGASFSTGCSHLFLAPPSRAAESPNTILVLSVPQLRSDCRSPLTTLLCLFCNPPSGVNWVDAGKVELEQGSSYLGLTLPFDVTQLTIIEVILVGGVEILRSGRASLSLPLEPRLRSPAPKRRSASHRSRSRSSSCVCRARPRQARVPGRCLRPARPCRRGEG